MGFFLPFTYIAGYVAVMYLAYSIACGLYYLADLAEEFPRTTQRSMQVASVVIIVFHILLWLFDSLPFLYIMVGIASHLAYLAQLRYFPFIDFAGVAFLASCAGCVASHVVWLMYFTSPIYYPVGYKMAFFLLNVWIIPFGFCLSLTVNDHVLPVGNDGHPVPLDDEPKAPLKIRVNMCKKWMSFFVRRDALPLRRTDAAKLT